MAAGIHPSVAKMWSAYLASTPDAVGGRYTSWHFCDNQPDADALAALVLAGTKRATAGSLLEYDLAGERQPVAGDYAVVTNWAGRAQCIIRTTRIDCVPFDQVTAEFAAAEGEGGGSLEYWRRVHWDYYGRVLAPLGAAPADDMLILCEWFEVVWPPRDQAGRSNT